MKNAKKMIVIGFRRIKWFGIYSYHYIFQNHFSGAKIKEIDNVVLHKDLMLRTLKHLDGVKPNTYKDDMSWYVGDIPTDWEEKVEDYFMKQKEEDMS